MFKCFNYGFKNENRKSLISVIACGVMLAMLQNVDLDFLKAPCRDSALRLVTFMI